MTMLCKMLTGQGFRANTPAFVAPFRATCLALAMIFCLGMSRAPHPAALPTPQNVYLVMPDCAGLGATVSVTMDGDYIDNYSGCDFEATVATNGCTATVMIPNTDCVPGSGTVTMATAVVRTKNGNIHAVFAVRAVDGVVIVDAAEF